LADEPHIGARSSNPNEWPEEIRQIRVGAQVLNFGRVIRMPMTLEYSPADEAFRTEIRAWLQANLPEGWADGSTELSPETRKKFNEEWPSKLYAGGWICASWPTEYGGKGLSTMQNVVLTEEFAAHRAPLRADFFGDTLVGPTILQYGTEEALPAANSQRAGPLVPGVLRAKLRF
jgi:alkylation response protein AidB-like acyl-CoA dehydrogenase